jgi:hypothetical protein
MDALDASPEEQSRALSAVQALELLKHLGRGSPSGYGARLLASLGEVHGMQHQLDGQLWDRLEVALRSGRLVVVPHLEAPFLVRTSGQEEQREEPALDFGQDIKPLSYVEFELVDRQGQGVAGQEFVLRAPDGSERRGVTDKWGCARIEGLEIGMCSLRFPKLDADSWRPA